MRLPNPYIIALTQLKVAYTVLWWNILQSSCLMQRRKPVANLSTFPWHIFRRTSFFSSSSFELLPLGHFHGVQSPSFLPCSICKKEFHSERFVSRTTTLFNGLPHVNSFIHISHLIHYYFQINTLPCVAGLILVLNNGSIAIFKKFLRTFTVSVICYDTTSIVKFIYLLE